MVMGRQAAMVGLGVMAVHLVDLVAMGVAGLEVGSPVEAQVGFMAATGRAFGGWSQETSWMASGLQGFGSPPTFRLLGPTRSQQSLVITSCAGVVVLVIRDTTCLRISDASET